jgi:hypothetical protein
LKKIGDSVQGVATATFDAAWNTTLAEYMMTQRTPFVKKQARKVSFTVQINKVFFKI